MGAFVAMRACACAFVLLAALAACGPVQSTAYLMDAEVQLEAARTAQAERYAPYEWTAANLYYRKAKEDIGYSEYQQAVDYAQKAQKFAVQARDNAMKTTRKDEPPPVTRAP